VWGAVVVATAVEPAAGMTDDAAAMTDADDQRAHPRAGFGLEVRLMLLREKQPIAATLENISEGGCYFATRAPVKEGAAVSVVFGLRPRGLCAASGRVVRVEASEGFGVRFNDINSYMREFVSTLARTEPEGRAEVAAAIVDPEIHII
jgi:PilZ domain